MNLLDDIKAIPIINDHTHIFGCGEVEDYEVAGQAAETASPEALLAGCSFLNMHETATVGVEKNPKAAQQRFLDLYPGRRTTFPVRAYLRVLRQEFGFEPDDLTAANAPALLERMRAKLPRGTDQVHEYLARLTNTEIWFCNHGCVATYEKCCPGTTRGRFRWVPYTFADADALNACAVRLGLDRPRTVDEMRAVLIAVLRQVKQRGAVAIKGGAFAYDLSRPFAPDMANLQRAAEAKDRVDRGVGAKADIIAMADAIAILTAQAAGVVNLPVQIHVGLIWSAYGPTRIPEIMALTPLFHACRETRFVIFHGGYPRTDDLAHVAATMSNVRAEFNWVPFWSGLDFSRFIGKWIDMIPNDRILYGTDGGGFVSVAHDLLTREGLAEALEQRVQRGYLSRKLALEIAAKMLRNNAIATYGLDRPEYKI